MLRAPSKVPFRVNQSDRFTRLSIYILSDNKNGSLPRWLCSFKKGRDCYRYTIYRLLWFHSFPLVCTNRHLAMFLFFFFCLYNVMSIVQTTSNIKEFVSPGLLFHASPDADCEIHQYFLGLCHVEKLFLIICKKKIVLFWIIKSYNKTIL